MRVKSVEGYGIKRGRETLSIGMFRQRLKAAISFKRITLTGKHPRRIFTLAFKGKYTSSVRELTGQIFTHQPLEQFAMIFKARQGNTGDLVARQRNRI